MIPLLGWEVEEGEEPVPIFDQDWTALSYFRPYFSAKMSSALSLPQDADAVSVHGRGRQGRRRSSDGDEDGEADDRAVQRPSLVV